MVQWLRLHPSIAGGMASVPSQGMKILHAILHAAGPKKYTSAKHSLEWASEFYNLDLSVPLLYRKKFWGKNSNIY